MTATLRQVGLGQLGALLRFLRLWFYGQADDLLRTYSERKAQALFAHLRMNGTWNCPELVMWR
jgi:hypothetical protein